MIDGAVDVALIQFLKEKVKRLPQEPREDLLENALNRGNIFTTK